MVPYQKRLWASHLFDIDGSMVRQIVGRVSVCVAWSAVVVVIHHVWVRLEISPTVHTLVGAALGLLLVFRTNASYDRYWEGRRQWGAITNDSRNLARLSRAYLAPADPELSQALMLWVSAFPYAAMNLLRNSEGLGPPGERLSSAEAVEISSAPHAPLAIATKLSAVLAEARDRGAISEYVMVMFDGVVGKLIDNVGACERIYKTPLPFVYVVHLRRALILYCFTLPLALVQFYDAWTILVTLLTSYTFFGIEEIGVEIENPFGEDPNDLPLEEFCATIEKDTIGTTPVEACRTAQG